MQICAFRLLKPQSNSSKTTTTKKLHLLKTKEIFSKSSFLSSSSRISVNWDPLIWEFPLTEPQPTIGRLTKLVLNNDWDAGNGKRWHQTNVHQLDKAMTVKSKMKPRNVWGRYEDDNTRVIHPTNRITTKTTQTFYQLMLNNINSI